MFWHNDSRSCSRAAATRGQTPYFAVFEAEFADLAAMTAARASPQGQQVAADVANYATGGAVVIHYPVQNGGTC
ncbi:MAG TPA: EthD family reductase [Streptosporangiaceae bacterium]|nr:EthD family reductase [Streptosporangiaceae bacterium]